MENSIINKKFIVIASVHWLFPGRPFYMNSERFVCSIITIENSIIVATKT